MADNKPSVLIIGGLGYIGRFLALYIHQNKLASEIRIVDKLVPVLANLAPEFGDACTGTKFMQADAGQHSKVAAIFDRADDKTWDYVFNCGGETRYSMEDDVYKLRSLELSLVLGKEAARRKVKVFVELSTGMVYKSDSSASKEGDKTKPWTTIAHFKLQAEQELAKIPGLNLVIIRLAHVYGPYALQWVSTALCMARTFKSLGQAMKWLYGKDLRTNTVHIDDATRALWAVAQWYDSGKKGWDVKANGNIPIFNVVDDGATSQGIMAKLIGQIFEIETGFQNTLISSFAKLNMDHVVEDLNDELLTPWAELLEKNKITRTIPLTPFMEKELLKDTDLSMDGNRLKRLVGFEYKKPAINRELLQEVIDSYTRMKWWPTEG